MPRQASWRDGFETESGDAFSAAVSYVIPKAVAAARPSSMPHPTCVTGGMIVSSESLLTTGVTGGAAVKPTSAAGRAGAMPCIGGCVDFSRRGSNTYAVILTWKACGVQTSERCDELRTHEPACCGYTNIDPCGSPKHAHKTFCRNCCTLVAEEAKRDIKVKREVLRKVERSAPHSPFEASRSQLEMYPDLVFGEADVEMFLGVYAHAVWSGASGVGIIVDRLQE